MDMWSVACTVYEMFTAEILFKGRDNNDMLRQVMALKGPFPKRMVKKGIFANLHFAGASRPALFKGCCGSQPVHVAKMCVIHSAIPLTHRRSHRRNTMQTAWRADDSSLSFISKEKDVVSGEPVRRLVATPAKRRSILQLLTRVAAKEHPDGIPRDELRKVESLAAFLERATALDPASRLTVAEAMQMKFIVMAKTQIAAQQAAALRKGKP